MPSPRLRRALLAPALAALALGARHQRRRRRAATTTSASSSAATRPPSTARATPRGCRVELAGGRFRGAPVGTGAYTGAAPARGRRGLPERRGRHLRPARGPHRARRRHAPTGSCSPSRATPARTAPGRSRPPSFTGLARFTVRAAAAATPARAASGVASLDRGRGQPPPDHARRPPRGWRRMTRTQRWTLAVVCAATAMLMLDIAVVNTALSAIAADLDTGLSGLQWVVDAYTLALAATVITAGSLADRFGRRRLFVRRPRRLHRDLAAVRRGAVDHDAQRLARGAGRGRGDDVRGLAGRALQRVPAHGASG